MGVRHCIKKNNFRGLKKNRTRRAFGKRPPAPRKPKGKNQAGHSPKRTVEGQGVRHCVYMRDIRGFNRQRGERNIPKVINPVKKL